MYKFQLFCWIFGFAAIYALLGTTLDWTDLLVKKNYIFHVWPTSTSTCHESIGCAAQCSRSECSTVLGLMKSLCGPATGSEVSGWSFHILFCFYLYASSDSDCYSPCLATPRRPSATHNPLWTLVCLKNKTHKIWLNATLCSLFTWSRSAVTGVDLTWQ